MLANASESLFRYINIEDYPLDRPESQAWKEAVDRIRAELGDSGCCVLPGFIKPDALELLSKQGHEVAPHAYRYLETVNAYNIDINSDLDEDHPAKVTFEKGNAFVAKDLIPQEHLISQLFSNTEFKQFVADCFNKEKIFELADPLAALCLNVLDPGRSHPWHFDKNEMTVSLLTQLPDNGGVFEYCPNIRSPEDENFTAVRKVVTGEGDAYINRLNLQPGDLQFFKGRFSLHRVTPVEGSRERHTAIFAYTDKPGIVGYPERTRQLFGRVLPEHEQALEQAIKNDALLD